MKKRVKITPRLLTFAKLKTNKDMANDKFNYRNEMKWEHRKAKEAEAMKNFKRYTIGLGFSAVVFFGVLLVTLNGMRFNSNVMMLLMVASLMGVFYFGRELRILPKGQIIFSAVKAVLCLGMALAYTLMHQGFWDWMDYGILGILVGVILLDVPRVIKATKELK